MNLRRAVRWAAASIAVLAAALLVAITAGFVPDYLSDKSHADKATFLSTVVGSIAFLAVIFQSLWWLRRRGSPDSIAVGLRIKVGKELDERLRDARRTAEDIALTYRAFGNSEKTDLDGLIDILLDQSGRIILTGQPGVGKSYTALQVAAALLRRDQSKIPVVVPLSLWTGAEEPTERLALFLKAEFDVSVVTGRELIHGGTVVPIFDGLDELGTDEAAVELLRDLVDWHIAGSRASFFLTSLRSTWDRMDGGLARHHTLAVFSILAVDLDDARQYLSRSLGGPGRTGTANELIEALQVKGHGYLLATPFPLSLVAEIFAGLLKQQGGISAEQLEQITDLVTVDNLIAYYVESGIGKNKRIDVKLRRAIDYWWLSNYAKYLEANRLQSRKVDGRFLPDRDLVLHRLWPIAGDRAPRLVDLAMCIVLSIPGFYWAGVFLWHRGLLARALLAIFGLIWLFLLVRTSTKPWVPSASPNWGRLTNPKFFLRQLCAALVIGLAAWFIVSPVAAAVCFVSAWLGIGLTVGFGQTLATDRQPTIVGPLGVLRRERQVSRFSAAVVFPVLAAGFSATWGFRIGLAAAFVYCLVVGETVACALWRRYLAMIIASLLRLPPDPAHCLERMHARGHLRIAGMSYQFRHEAFRRYFAQRHGLRGHWAAIALGDQPNRES
jgi:hypothetical protein